MAPAICTFVSAIFRACCLKSGLDDAASLDWMSLRNAGFSGSGGGSAVGVAGRPSVLALLGSGDADRLEAFDVLGDDEGEMRGMESSVG
ncbi:hypothetical protein [Burkholderia sp. AU6039]|uniref:hypothetical protein n=1 Tax=Burkholderia sp. AU6039 TaxID=2015344 RepID=UPI00118050C8|nr:hypothetical protein [Burkholderia sp. AU6039]